MISFFNSLKYVAQLLFGFALLNFADGFIGATVLLIVIFHPPLAFMLVELALT